MLNEDKKNNNSNDNKDDSTNNDNDFEFGPESEEFQKGIIPPKNDE